MKKRVLVMLIVAVMLVIVPSVAFAAITGAELKQYPTPFLITSGGQGAGSKMFRLLITSNKAVKLTYSETGDFYLEDETPARYDYIDSGRYKALVVVMSVTEKGLGASGITIEDEIKFLKEVVKKAKEQNMPIIAVSLEKDARSKIATNGNERVIATICPEADWIITIKENNDKTYGMGSFDEIGAKYGIPVTIIDKPLDLVTALPKIFVK